MGGEPIARLRCARYGNVASLPGTTATIPDASFCTRSCAAIRASAPGGNIKRSAVAASGQTSVSNRSWSGGIFERTNKPSFAAGSHTRVFDRPGEVAVSIVQRELFCQLPASNVS